MYAVINILVYSNPFRHLHSTLTLTHEIVIYTSWFVSVARVSCSPSLVLHLLFVKCAYECYRYCICRETKFALRLLKALLNGM